MNREYLFARKILTLGKAIIANRNQNLKNIGLTAEQADSLIYFSEHPKTSIRSLSNYLRVTHQTASGIVKRLQEKNAVSAAPSPNDARCSLIELSAHGNLLLDQLKENGTHTGSKILSGMSAEERDEFQRLLDQALSNTVKRQDGSSSDACGHE